MDNRLKDIVSHFDIDGEIVDIKPLGAGLINDSYEVDTDRRGRAYVLQRINHNVFRDVELLQNNIEKVTAHIRKKLIERNEADIDRKVLQFTRCGGKTYYFDDKDYWRVMVFISDSYTHESVNPEYSYCAGKAFGDFQSMLADIDEVLGETIPDFHNMEFRLKQLRDAIDADKVGRLDAAREMVDRYLAFADEMCLAERLHREGKLPKRICHCDTKVNNMLFDKDGNVLCVIDLDTVMPSFVFSDFGDFLRTAANTGMEDDPDLDNVDFDMDIFRAFAKGYLESASSFLTETERGNLHYAAALFPYMTGVRFLADYLDGDNYFKTQYDDHNLVRAKAQFKLFESVRRRYPEMKAFVEDFK